MMNDGKLEAVRRAYERWRCQYSTDEERAFVAAQGEEGLESAAAGFLAGWNAAQEHYDTSGDEG